jgi:hypothetical protein
MLLNIAGSSEESTTGMPWFMITGRGCMGIDEVRRYHFYSVAVGSESMYGKLTSTSFLWNRSKWTAGVQICVSLTILGKLQSRSSSLDKFPSIWDAWWVKGYRNPEVSEHEHSASCRTTNPCPIRFDPSRIASYKFISAAVPSPRVSPAWKRNGMSGCCSAKRKRGSA